LSITTSPGFGQAEAEIRRSAVDDCLAVLADQVRLAVHLALRLSDLR
jgi:hypothetical protein